MAINAMRVRLWNTGDWSVYAPTRALQQADPSASTSTNEDDEAAPVAVPEADGQFQRIWTVTPHAESRACFVETAVFDCVNDTQAFTIMLPLAVSIFRLTFMLTADNVGDVLYMDVARGAVVARTTEAGDAGDTCLSVSEPQYFFPGCDLVTSTSENGARYTVTSVDRGVVRFWPGLKAAEAEGRAVGFAVPVLKGFAITRPGDYEVSVGGRFLPQSCPLTLVYTNRSGTAKQCALIVEYTT